MAPEDVEALFREETAHIEWKESHEAKDLLDAVCAFANDLTDSKRAGFVVIGVHARTGKPCGKYPQATTDSDKVQQALVSLISSTKIIPHPVVHIETLQREGHVVFVLRVEPYAVPPVVKVNGTPYVRVATVTQRANEAQYRNPKITQLLLAEGYVERAGRGVRRAEALLAREGHPPLAIETNGYTTITVRRRGA